ncbi:hypothetical protein Dda_0035 [Drechslerella dactyloides]|uniref:Uncharacterized protein n=1 Tax=Drechslerella dactyloides TaxID=74499 RepID=A0AAD6J3S8_DREDA|nr:hypothetical protein Dda_0035 [Drechslerella dactyloides]
MAGGGGEVGGPCLVERTGSCGQEMKPTLADASFRSAAKTGRRVPPEKIERRSTPKAAGRIHHDSDIDDDHHHHNHKTSPRRTTDLNSMPHLTASR